MKLNGHKAFTLIELLVVVAIIGILAAVGVVAYNGYTASAKANSVKTNFSLIKKYIYSEVMKCQLGEQKIANGTINCPPDTFGVGIYTKFMTVFKTGEITLRNPYNNDFQVNNGNIYNRDEDVGYIRFNIIGGAEQFIRIKSCIKLPCSDTSNHIEEIIVSDMISK